MNRQLYVMPCFLKPGKQTFVVQSLMYQKDITSIQSSIVLQPENGYPGYQRVQSDKSYPQSSPKTRSIESVDLSEDFFFHQTVVP